MFSAANTSYLVGLLKQQVERGEATGAQSKSVCQLNAMVTCIPKLQTYILRID